MPSPSDVDPARRSPAAEAPPEFPPGPPPGTPFLAGLALTGAGLGLQAASHFQLGSRAGLGTPWDGRVFGLVGLALIGLGAVFFGPLARSGSRAGSRAGGFAAALVAAAVSVLALSVIAATTTPLGFKAHCARFGADASLAGTLRVDASAALVMFILPAFGIGAVLASRGRWFEVVAAAVGLAAGWLGFPLAFDAMESLDWKNAGSAGLVLYGAMIVGAGMALSAAFRRPTSRAWCFGGAALTLLAAVVPISPIQVYPPWQRFPIKPFQLFETSRAQYTVTPTGAAGMQVLMDQRPISPNDAELALEAACLQRSFGALAATSSPWPPRTLVVGLVTPERADLLAAFGVEAFDRTALWYDDLDLLEAAVWGEGKPQGLAISPAELSSAAPYDLVLTFPVGAYLAAGWQLELLDLMASAATHAWLPGDMPIQAAPTSDARLAFASRGLEAFAFGWMTGASPGTGGPAPQVAAVSLDWMTTRAEARPFDALREVAEGAEPALALHAAAQRISSPFDAPLVRIALVPEALALWRDQALAAQDPLPIYLHGVIEGAAAALMAQGEVPWVFEFLAPVAARFPDNVALQVALAWAEAQELRHDLAATRLRPLVASLPGRRDLKIALAEALVAQGDPEGRGIANQLLRNDPENPRLFGLARGLRGMTTLATPGGYESLSQEEALALADGAVLGTITGISVQEIDPGDGVPLFLTTLTVSGTEIASGEGSRGDSKGDSDAPRFGPEQSHEVTFLGGFTEPEHGTFNSTAPPAHQARIGRRIFYYYQAQDDIAGGVSGNALLRGRAGLFTAFETRAGELIVQGRGNAAAIPYNLVRDELNAPH